VAGAGQRTREQLLLELEELTIRLQEAEDTLEAIRSGGVDALVVTTAPGEEQLFTLEGADRVYRVFLESISEGAVTLGDDGLIVYANEAAHRLLAAEPEGLVGHHLRDRVRAEERRSFDALLERARHAPVRAEVRVRGERGGRPLYLSMRPLQDRDDRMVTVVLTDLVEQKATEAALESERLARSVFEQAGEPIIVCDRSGVVIRASRAAVKLIGREPLLEELATVLPLRTWDGREEFSLAELGGRSMRAREVRFERADGASFSLILTASPLTAPGQGRIGSVVTLTDITRRQEAEQAREHMLQELEQANKELETIDALARAGLQLTTVDQLAHSVVSQVALAMDADEVALLLVEEGHVRLAAAVPPIAGGRGPVDVGSGFVGSVLKMGRSLFVEDVASSSLLTPGERERGDSSVLGSALLDGERVLGALCVGWKEPHTADAGQQRFLEIIAARATDGISARLLAEQRDEERLTAEALAAELAEANVQMLGRQEVLELLQELTKLASSSLSLTEIGGRVLELVHQRLGLATGAIFALEPAARELQALALIGFSDEATNEMQVLPLDDESTITSLVRNGLPIVTHESGPLPARTEERLREAVGTAAVRWVAIPVQKGDSILGVLGLTFLGKRPFEEDEFSLYRSIAELLAAAFENARLYREERRVAQTEERNRLARDLHDSITQALFAAALKAEALLQSGDIPESSVDAVEGVRRLTRGALAQMRTMLLELRAESPEDVPIEQLLRNVAEATEGRANIVVAVDVRGDRGLPQALHAAVYRVTQEALNNVARHSGARRASVVLQIEERRVRLLISDDGRGFQLAEVAPTHLGMRSMRERAAEVGAELRVVSAPGEGTLIIMDRREGEKAGPLPT
jgi:PAS domain S-box-containing protein